MAVTINVNGMSLAHRGSNGTAIATLPDVCKTPSPGGPVPLPYPNIARSADLTKGTKSVQVDGGQMAAHQDSELAKSSGDEPGTAGGVKSSTNMKEATWLTYSFDVKLEGKGACRLTDKLLMNHGNTMCCAGFLQQFLRGPKGPTECAALLARIVVIIGEGMVGKTDGIRGLAERFAQQITGAGSPTAPFDRPPNSQLGFDRGSNSWMRHDREIQEQQESLRRHLDAYDEHCKGGPPPPPHAREWVTKPRPTPAQWTGPATAPAPSSGFSWGALGAAAGLTVLTVGAFLIPFDGPVGEAAAGAAAFSAWAVVFGAGAPAAGGGT